MIGARSRFDDGRTQQNGHALLGVRRGQVSAKDFRPEDVRRRGPPMNRGMARVERQQQRDLGAVSLLDHPFRGDRGVYDGLPHILVSV